MPYIARAPLLWHRLCEPIGIAGNARVKGRGSAEPLAERLLQRYLPFRARGEVLDTRFAALNVIGTDVNGFAIEAATGTRKE